MRDVKIPKSYRRLTGSELRHRAGLAWVRGKRDLAAMLELMSLQVAAKRRPGQHGCVTGNRRKTSYPSFFENKLLLHRSV